MIKNLTFILIFFALAFEMKAQSLKSEQLDVVTRNILSYHFRYALNYELNLKSDKVIKDGDYFFNELWPKENQNLKLNASPSKLKYPDKDFIVYEINKRGFQVGNDSVRISRKLTSFEADDVYLIAVDSSDQEMKFISGNFFQSSIESDFNLNVEQPKTFNNYLNYRTYNWSVESIEYKGLKKGKLIFSAYSQYLKKHVRIEVDEVDFDKVIVKQLEKRVTY